MSRFRVSASILALSLLATSARAAEPCLRKLLREFDYVARREVEYFSVEGVRFHHGKVIVTELFGKKDEILIGAQGAHAYLYVDGVRYDAGVLFKPGAGLRKRVTAIPAGTLIRFKDIPAEQIARLRAQLLERKGTSVRSASCVHGVCEELSRAGIQVKGGQPLMPAALYERMIADGFTDTQGKPLQVEIIKMDRGDLHETVDEFLQLQDEIIIRLAVKGTSYVVMVGGAAGAVYYVYDKVAHGSPEPKSKP